MGCMLKGYLVNKFVTYQVFYDQRICCVGRYHFFDMADLVGLLNNRAYNFKGLIINRAMNFVEEKNVNSFKWQCQSSKSG